MVAVLRLQDRPVAADGQRGGPAADGLLQQPAAALLPRPHPRLWWTDLGGGLQDGPHQVPALDRLRQDHLQTEHLHWQ